MTLLVVVLGAGGYGGALPLCPLFRGSRPAPALGAASEAITALNAQLTRRDSALLQTVRGVHALARTGSPRADSLALARRLLVAGHEPLHVPTGAPSPPTLLTAPARIAATLSGLRAPLAELVAPPGPGRPAEL